MSAKAGTIAAPSRPIASTVIAVVLALVVGATAGSLITRAVTSDDIATESVVGIAPWDQQKLDAMEQRQGAAVTAGSAPGIAPWDSQKVDAMEGFQASAGRGVGS